LPLLKRLPIVANGFVRWLDHVKAPETQLGATAGELRDGAIDALRWRGRDKTRERAVTEQILIVVTPDDELVGYATRDECHRGRGQLHRALAGVVFNERGQVLLQKRMSQLWDGYWDITAATHPLHLPTCDESYAAAMRRCLLAEWGVEVAMVVADAFVYYDSYGQHCENEYCTLLVGRYDGPVHPHADHAYDMQWLDFEACAADIAAEPNKYTPWARLAIHRLAGHPLARGKGRLA
jgi:isopentenyl-diphosphate delta-isomerase